MILVVLGSENLTNHLPFFNRYGNYGLNLSLFSLYGKEGIIETYRPGYFLGAGFVVYLQINVDSFVKCYKCTQVGMFFKKSY